MGIGDTSQFNPFNQSSHYHDCSACPSSCDIQDWNNQNEVELCRLAGLPDLDQSNSFVASQLNQWIAGIVKEYGFDGLRVDTTPEVRLAGFCDAHGSGSIGRSLPAFPSLELSSLSSVLLLRGFAASLLRCFAASTSLSLSLWLVVDVSSVQRLVPMHAAASPCGDVCRGPSLAAQVDMAFWQSFNKAAGVYAVGEVENGDPSYVGPYQGGALDATLSYPMFYVRGPRFPIPHALSAVDAVRAVCVTVLLTCRCCGCAGWCVLPGAAQRVHAARVDVPDPEHVAAVPAEV
jgi:hypothetical protein